MALSSKAKQKRQKYFKNVGMLCQVICLDWSCSPVTWCISRTDPFFWWGLPPSFHLKTLYHLLFSSQFPPQSCLPSTITSSLALPYQPSLSALKLLTSLRNLPCIPPLWHLTCSLLFPTKYLKEKSIPAASTSTPESSFCFQCWLQLFCKHHQCPANDSLHGFSW